MKTCRLRILFFARFQHTVPPFVTGRYAGVI